MKKSRFTESLNIGILKEAESGLPITELYRQFLLVMTLLHCISIIFS